MKTSRRVSWRYLLSFTALVLIVALAFLNQSRVVSLVIDPVTRLSWLVTRSLLMVDQEVYWTALIFVVLAFGLRLIPAASTARRSAHYAGEAGPEDRAAEWEKLFRRAAEDEAGRRALQTALNGLHEDLVQAAGESKEISVDLPPVKQSRLAGRFNRRAWYFIQNITGRKRRLETDYESGIEQILDRLESIMERQNDQDEHPAINC
ncbi:MAG: hypothetical protein AB9891_00965 [Anaerolineaceae bacterium]